MCLNTFESCCRIYRWLEQPNWKGRFVSFFLRFNVQNKEFSEFLVTWGSICAIDGEWRGVGSEGPNKERENPSLWYTLHILQSVSNRSLSSDSLCCWAFVLSVTQLKSPAHQIYTSRWSSCNIFGTPSHNGGLLLSEVEPGTIGETDLGEFRTEIRQKHLGTQHDRCDVLNAGLRPQLVTSHPPFINNGAEGRVVPCCECGLMGKHRTSQGGWCVCRHYLLMVDLHGQRCYRALLNLFHSSMSCFFSASKGGELP